VTDPPGSVDRAADPAAPVGLGQVVGGWHLDFFSFMCIGVAAPGPRAKGQTPERAAALVRDTGEGPVSEPAIPRQRQMKDAYQGRNVGSCHPGQSSSKP
jgi:hypothetical protein